LRDRLRVDVVSLASGAVIAALGAVVLLDSTGALAVSIGWIAVVLTGAAGLLLVIGGLADSGPDRHD
jgi:hypothetical protein